MNGELLFCPRWYHGSFWALSLACLSTLENGRILSLHPLEHLAFSGMLQAWQRHDKWSKIYMRIEVYSPQMQIFHPNERTYVIQVDAQRNCTSPLPRARSYAEHHCCHGLQNEYHYNNYHHLVVILFQVRIRFHNRRSRWGNRDIWSKLWSFCKKYIGII